MTGAASPDPSPNPASGAALRVGLGVTLVAGTALVVLGALLVPWDPVPGGPLVPPDPLSVFTAGQVERAEEFSRWARVWSWSSLAVSTLLACWFGFSRRGRAVVARFQRGPWWLRVVQAVAVLTVAGRLVTLPLGLAHRQHLRGYGLSTQSWAGYALDLLKGEALDIVVTSLAVLVVMACARRWRRWWPAVAGSLVAALVLAGSFAYPVLVEPLFSSFETLPAGSLRTEILDLADKEGVEVDEVLVADASRRTTTLNAYVSGFGGTRRVVVYDNLVEDLPPEQALSVVAHELAHARHDDVLVGSVLGALGGGLAVGLLAVVLALGGRRGGRTWSMADPAVVPVLLALFAVGSLLASPVENTVSRQIETRADVDALETTGDPAAFVEMQRQLMLRSLADPTPYAWSQFWFGSHPTGLDRIALAQRVAERLDR
ncbi:M48 family metallopeptidase [Nocardioides pantholopis]|uniref:M48 family metallopeptidase n=1 Tax=Nocardioides pantholopis TaxID=2483798 RepID=UPI000F07B4BC|nr:M48 family metallopeptidase [Nocardioides pantholopis]